MYQELIKERKADFEAAVQHAHDEAANIRTGRATPDLVDDLPVEYHGSTLTIKELAAISVPEPRSLAIQPWDKGALALIEKAIRNSQLGLAPVTDGTAVRLTIPPLTEERRKEYVRLLHQKMEEVRIRVRQTREDILKKVQAAVREKTAREDDVRNAKDELQKVVDDVNGRIEEIKERKEKELMAT